MSKVPQVFINGVCIGGGTETKQLFESGRLKQLTDSCQSSWWHHPSLDVILLLYHPATLLGAVCTQWNTGLSVWSVQCFSFTVGGHPPGRHWKVREIVSGRVKVRENRKSWENVYFTWGTMVQHNQKHLECGRMSIRVSCLCQEYRCHYCLFITEVLHKYQLEIAVVVV